MRGWRPAFVLVAVLALSGCTSGPPVWGDEVAMDAPAEGGLGPRRVTVTVDDGARPLNGPVILFWTDPSPSEGDTIQVYRLGLRGRDGTAVGWVPDDRVVHTVAAAPGHTEEWVQGAFPVDGPDERSIRLFASTRHWELTDAWSGTEVAVPFARGLIWHPGELRLAQDDATNRALQERVGSLDGTLRWENTATAFADLGVIAATRGPPDSCAYFDGEDDLGPGTYEQPFQMPYSGCGFLADDITRIEPPIDIGPATDDHMLAPLDGVPYTINVTVGLVPSFGWQDFMQDVEGRDVDYHWAPTRGQDGGVGPDAPAWGVLGPLAALALAGVSRRKGW